MKLNNLNLFNNRIELFDWADQVQIRHDTFINNTKVMFTYRIRETSIAKLIKLIHTLTDIETLI